MGFNDYHYELYMNRKVWMATLAQGVVSGVVMPPADSVLADSVGLWVEEHWENGVVAQKKKIFSASGVLDLYDDEPLWNSCPVCGVNPGYPCDMTVEELLPVEEEEDYHYNRQGRVQANARMKLQGEKQEIRQRRKELKRGKPHVLVSPELHGYL